MDNTYIKLENVLELILVFVQNNNSFVLRKCKAWGKYKKSKTIS